MNTERLHEIVTLLADSANGNESLAIEAHRLLNAASQPPSGDHLTINETTLRNAWARLDQVGDPKTPHALWKHLRNEAQPPSGDAPIRGFVPSAAEPMTPDEIAALRGGALLTMDGAEDLIERLLATIEARSQPPSGDAPDLQRYSIESENDGSAWMEPDPEGSYVLFRDVRPIPTPAPLDVEARQLISELAHGYHSYGLIKDHHDPADKTQWIVRGIETCADPLCVAACVYEEGTDAPANA